MLRYKAEKTTCGTKNLKFAGFIESLHCFPTIFRGSLFVLCRNMQMRICWVCIVVRVNETVTSCRSVSIRPHSHIKYCVQLLGAGGVSRAYPC